MDFVDAQKDMRLAYLGGSTGVLASGLVWLASGLTGLLLSPVAAIIALFIGGTFIYPLSVLFSKLLSAAGKHKADNPLGPLALETLPILFGGLLIAFYVAQLHPNVFFPIMLLTIGARYFVFQSLYGIKEYWFLGAALIAAGVLCTVLDLPFITGAFVGGVLEVLFAPLIFKKRNQ